jgi:hypothetical protein
MSYWEGDSVSSIYTSTNSNLKRGLSSASTKLELLRLLVDVCDLSVPSGFEFNCKVQLTLHDCRVSVSRCCLFRLSLLRIVKVIKQPSSFTSFLLLVLFYSVNIRGP